MLLAGGPAFYADIETVSQRDLQRAELIAFPFALVALLFVFGTAVAALLPMVVGGLGVAAVLMTIFALAHVTDLSIFVLNLATMTVVATGAPVALSIALGGATLVALVAAADVAGRRDGRLRPVPSVIDLTAV